MRSLLDGRSNRRELLTRALAGVGLLALGEGGLAAAWRGLEMAGAAEPPPETTTIKVARDRTLVGTCTAPLYVADRFLQAEGFTNVKYVEYEGLIPRYKGVAAGQADVSQGYSASLIVNIDKGDSIVILSGAHVGCFELVATDRVRSIRDLKGKTVSVTGLGLTEHVYLSILAAYVGLNPVKDINWVIYTRGESERLLREGKIDALMGFPPFIQGIRAKKIGHVVLNSMIDRPWSGYFCCMPFANRDFVRKHPVAAKRWLRAYLKTADFLARQPEQATRILVDRGYSNNYTSVLQTLQHEVDYGKWRDFDPEDTVRFNALRLHEVGMIKSSPQKLITQGTNWRFLNEIKRELKSRGAIPGGTQRRITEGRRWSRREILAGATAAGAAAFFGSRWSGLAEYPFLTGQTGTAAEAPPETTTIKILKLPVVCIAPQYLAEDFLRREGFTDVQYVAPKPPATAGSTVTSGDVDITMAAMSWLPQADRDDNFVLLAGIHIGCYELFGTESIRTVRDLKGKTVGIISPRSGHHLIAAAMAAYVGLDPNKDIRWVAKPSAESIELLRQGKIDAYIGWPPDPQELRARKIGHVLVSMNKDRPWSQYYCCLVGVNRDFLRNHPIATKRALRAILKAADVCASEPERVARLLVDRGYTPRFDYALQAMREVPYETWRSHDPEDSVRFYALRLIEAGMLKSSPQKIIARNTDWRFLRELKTELKRSAIPGQMHHEHHKG